MSDKLARLKTGKYLEEKEIFASSIDLNISDELASLETGKYLEEKGIFASSIDLNTEEGRKAATTIEKLQARKLILRILIVPMCIIPPWLMIILTLPVFGVNKYSDTMNIAFLATLTTDVLGLFIIVTRNLFPKSNLEDDQKS